MHLINDGSSHKLTIKYIDILYITCIKRLERNDALEGIHSLPMQKIFTKRMQNTVKKYREQRFLEEKYL
jgi:hypothetical protein